MSNIKFICTNCEQHLEGDLALLGKQVQCPSCRKPFTATPLVALAQQSKGSVAASVEANGVQQIASKLSGHLTSFADVEKLEGFSLKDLFSEVFRKHTREEIEEYFIVGTEGVPNFV